MAPVCVPSGSSPLKLVERCLGINECLGAAWEALKGQGVFITYDDDENGVPRVYESVYGLLSGADEAAAQCPNDPDLEVNANSFDWLEGLANTCQVPGTQTSSGSPAGPALGCSLKRQANLVHHIDPRWTVGVHGAEASHIDITGISTPW